MRASVTYLLGTAYRDSRKNRGKLMMFMSSIVLGMAALVAINSFNYNLVRDIDRQAATLLGADIAINGNKPLTEELESIVDSLNADRASQLSMFSMAYLPKTDETQFVNIKALEGEFPFYGILKTIPVQAERDFRIRQSALVDQGMMLQYNLVVGDTIRLGQSSFVIAGELLSVFGGAAIGGSFAPAVYISRDYLAETELLQPGSLVDYDFYLKVDKTIDVDDWRKQHRTQFGNSSMRIETIQSRQNNLKEAFSGLNYFLNLVALVSLLLGCIGVASSVMIYVKSKLSTIAIFRCLGMSGQQSFQIYFFQIVTLGILGVLVGGLLGSAIQYLLPLVLQDFLPYEVDITFSSRALVEGLAIGSVVVTLFALLPLLGIRHISPLRTLRVSDQVSGRWAEPSRIMVVLGILLSLGLFLWRVMDDWIGAIVFVVSMIVAFVLLWIVARVVTWAIRRFYPRSLPYVYRQGLSNLYRPNNQTQTLIISIGLGTAVLTTLFIVQGLLLSNVASMDAGDQPNVILYGIERDQTDGVAELTSQHELPIIQQVPIVTMALEGWQGRTKKEWLADTTRTAQRWAINREARVSFRDHLEEDETLVRGEWTGEVDPGDSIKISVADTWADAMDIDIGDELIWNVQGARITTYVGSIREIEFRSMRTRFFILFPKGVLEQAPQFQVIVTKSPSTAATASYRSAVVKAFPNVSVVDLGSILSALSDILNKVSYVIQFMAAFCIFTGIIVLISSLLLSKFQRIRESVLLRTVGASSRQILSITTTEYVLLGMLSALTGIVIALIGGYLLAVYQLELDYHIQWIPIVSVFLFVTVVTVLIGLANSRDVINNAPMEVLRKEV